MEAGSGSSLGPEPTTTVLSLPEGASMMIGEDGEQYVTISQDGQTYAIPLAEYQSMQPGGTITIQAQQISQDELMNPPQIVVQASDSTQTPSSDTLSPKSGIKWANPMQNSISKPWATSSNDISNARRYKPIKVDNWGIFLLSRLQTYFQKKEYTDLTLRFPAKNAQIKVHKLIINACTEYFIKQEEAGMVIDGIFDMPSHFLPESVAPIIRFMYTGRLDLKSHMFNKLRETASLLGMAVLTKLLDAQINAPPEMFNKKKKVDLDPIRQMKRIKKVERKFERDIKMKNANQTHLETDKIVPGKKLPIWKKRETKVNIEMNEIDIKPEPAIPQVTKAYGKQPSPQNKENQREIQENANFEKIRESANQKVSLPETVNNYDESDNDDYYDNDAGLDYDEAIEEDDIELNDSVLTPAKPILKTSDIETPPSSYPRKSVRFSLRPGKSTEIITPDNHEDFIEEESITDEIKTPPKKRKTEDLDETLEEFSKAAEAEEKELKTTRRGRVIHPPNLESPSEIVKKAKKSSPKSQDHSQMIADLMRKNPDLFKGNKPVKIKVMTKDANGKNVVKVITVKAQPQSEKSIDLTPKVVNKSSPVKTDPKPQIPTTAVVAKEGNISLRATPKVKYTGKRGRPPIIKPGELDPHAKERDVIENNLKLLTVAHDKTSEDSFATFDQESEKLTESENTSLDPSSEAESLSQVASGIAASLGLPVDSAEKNNETERSEGPLSDLEHFNFESSRKRGRSEIENSPSPPKKVSKLALEWTEDEEEKS